MFIFYNISVRMFYLFALFSSLFNKKARSWINGRKNWDKNLKQAIQGESDLIWVHCSSLGEFEQGRPVIDALYSRGEKILLTFFSPSGYENLKNYKSAFHVAYLPLDTRMNAKKFLEIADPKAVMFVKYEFWFNFIHSIRQSDKPLFLISGIFRKEHYFFKWYGFWARKQLRNFTNFFLQDKDSEQLLNSINITNSDVCGDSRFDRVSEIAKNPKDVPEVENFCKNSKILIAGSTWHEDEILLKKFLHDNSEYKLVIAPHDVNHERIKSLKSEFEESTLLSDFRSDIESRVLIIDKIGFLSSIYRYGTLAYIGGGFGKGIHNTLEAAVFGKAVVFGKNYAKFREARELIEKKGAFSVNNEVELLKVIENLDFEKAGAICREYVANNTGATNFIISYLQKDGILKLSESE